MSKYITANNKVRNFTSPLNFKIVERHEVNFLFNSINVIKELKNLDLDGIIVKKFLQEREIDSMLSSLYKDIGTLDEGLKKSLTYPMTFSSLDRASIETMPYQLESYFTKAKEYRTKFVQQFGTDIEKKFGELFSELNYNCPAKVLELGENKSYISSTFRVIVPGKNHINLHCGNQFIHLFPEFYAPLVKIADVWNQLSFFTVLEKPEIGGELSVYNVTYDVAQSADIENQEIILKTDKRLNPEDEKQLYRKKFDIQRGDLILFSAGQLWHRVEEVYGNKPRITIGGFMGFSKSNNDVYYWS